MNDCLQPDVDLNSRSGTCHSYRLEGQPVKEEEERDAEEKARAGTTSLVEDAPYIKSRPAPCDVLHAHTPTSEAARMQCSLDVNSGTPGTTEPEECGAVWDLPLTSLSLNVIKSMLRKLDSTTTMDAAPRMTQVAGASVPILVDFYTTGPSVDPSPLTAIPAFRASVVSCATSLLVALRKEYLSGDRGQAPASDYLGRTQPIYEFVRRTLGIRMHGSENESVFANGLGVEDVTIGQNVTLIHEVRDMILSIAQADPSSYRCRGAAGVALGRSIAARDGPDKPSTGARTRGRDAHRRGARSPS